MELLCQYFPTQDQQRRMSHFSLLRKSLCIIKMLPGNTPAVHIFYSMRIITRPCQILASCTDKKGGVHILLTFGWKLVDSSPTNIFFSLIKSITKTANSSDSFFKILLPLKSVIWFGQHRVDFCVNSSMFLTATNGDCRYLICMRKKCSPDFKCTSRQLEMNCWDVDWSMKLSLSLNYIHCYNNAFQ